MSKKHSRPRVKINGAVYFTNGQIAQQLQAEDEFGVLVDRAPMTGKWKMQPGMKLHQLLLSITNNSGTIEHFGVTFPPGDAFEFTECDDPDLGHCFTYNTDKIALIIDSDSVDLRTQEPTILFSRFKHESGRAVMIVFNISVVIFKAGDDWNVVADCNCNFKPYNTSDSAFTDSEKEILVKLGESITADPKGFIMKDCYLVKVG